MLIPIVRIFLNGGLCDKRTADITRHAPRVASLIAPGIHIRISPVTKGIQNSSILVEQGIPHHGVAGVCLRLGPVVARRSCVCQTRTCSVGIVRAIGNTSCVLISPVARNTTIVIFEVVDSPFSPGFGVNLFASKTGRVACTCSLAGA